MTVAGAAAVVTVVAGPDVFPKLVSPDREPPRVGNVADVVGFVARPDSELVVDD